MVYPIEIRDLSPVERLPHLLPRPDMPYDDVIRRLPEKNSRGEILSDKLAYDLGQVDKLSAQLAQP
ncbi:MAG: hypothetical protein QXP98_05090 [Thermoproteus sp.]